MSHNDISISFVQTALEALPQSLKAVIFDFDGVFTDNKVWVLQDGTEAVRCDRGDGLMVGIFRERFPEIALQVISKEKNPVVMARCQKLKIDCLHGIDHKLDILKQWCKDRDIDLSELVYLGNDLNDLECIQAVGCGVAVADAYPEIKAVADLVLLQDGGNGAVRELLSLVSFHLGRA